MTNRIVCPFYCKNDDYCDIGCGYISPSDVRVIIQFCSSRHQGCPKYRELAERYPEIGAAPFQAFPTQGASRPKDSADRPRAAETNDQNGPHLEEPAAKADLPAAEGDRAMGPLGLLGFGMPLTLLGLQHTGIFPLDTLILGMALFYGGVAQVLAGVMEYRRDNTFGVIAFTSYGLFWASLVAIIVLPETGFGSPPKPAAMSAYLAMWALFSALLFIGSLRSGRALQLVFSSLTGFFIVWAAGVASASPIVTTLAGYQGIACGLTALCTAAAQIARDIFGHSAAPLGGIKKI